MNCPIDATPLAMTERSGIEIDYCPQCRGVWLDRGELDKIIERVAGSESPAEAEHREDDKRDEHGSRPGRRRRRGLLGDLFEFGE